MNNKSLLKALAVASLVAVAAIMPLFLTTRYVYVLASTLPYTIVGVCFFFLLQAGLANFALISFMGLGAYSSSLSMMKLGLSFWPALLLGGLISLVVALITGSAVLRCKGPYFLLVTIAFTELFKELVVQFSNLTGGFNGLTGIPHPTYLKSDAARYLLIVFMVFVSLLIIYRLNVGWLGKVLRGMGPTEDLEKSVGINTNKYKLIAFAIVSFFAGISGALSAQAVGYVSPESIGMMQMFYLILYVVVGGETFFAGPIVGIIAMRIVQSLITHGSVYEPVIFGGLMVVILRWSPKGLLGAISALYLKLSKSKAVQT